MSGYHIAHHRLRGLALSGQPRDRPLFFIEGITNAIFLGPVSLLTHVMNSITLVRVTQYPTSVSTFSDWFKRQLRIREWTQADFVRRADLSTSTVSTWTTGARNPDPRMCDVIADVLGVDIDVVLLMAGHRPNVEAIDPDDPRVMLHGMIDRINWSEERVDSIRVQLQTMINRDRKIIDSVAEGIVNAVKSKA